MSKATVETDRQTIRIPSVEDNSSLHAWFYRPSASVLPPYPVIVAGHGMALVKEAGLDAFGQCWAADAGYAVLIFDYRGFGDSEGTPREYVSIRKQIQDYQSVIAWARDRPTLFRADKMVVAGTSFSGMPSAEVVLQDPELAGFLAQCPVLDGYGTMMSLPPNIPLIFWAIVDTIKSSLRLSPHYVPAIGKPEMFAFLMSPSSYPGFTALYEGTTTPFSERPNHMLPRVVFELMGCRPGRKLKEVTCPVLISAAEKDDIIPLSLNRRIVKEAGGEVKFHILPGTHFDILLPGTPAFQENLQVQTEFLRGLLQ